MDNQHAYNAWSGTYDTVVNKTRDLEGAALRRILSGIRFQSVLEIGCGTGKNTNWLAEQAVQVIGADFSADMLARAKEKALNPNITFRQMDVREPWPFEAGQFDLITCSLVLEHIEDLGFVFEQASAVLRPGGYFYFGELHPFKQYLGSKARFDTGEGVFELTCHVHHVSDYMDAALKHQFTCTGLQEWFDTPEEGGSAGPPRILTMLFRRV
jgi:SAM-dependent methyltransferase